MRMDAFPVSPVEHILSVIEMSNNIQRRIGITMGQADQVIDAYVLGIETTIPLYDGEFHFFTRKIKKNKEIRCMTYHSPIFNFMLNDYKLEIKVSKNDKKNNMLVIRAANLNLNESVTIFIR